MKTKIKHIAIPFCLMIIFNLGAYYFLPSKNFGWGLSPHYGILFVSGLLLGPYGAFGSVSANFLCDIIRGYNPEMAFFSEVISFVSSYLAFKLWYGNFKIRNEIMPPKLNNTFNILLFLGISIICSLIYAVLNANLDYFYYPNLIPIYFTIIERIILNFVNFSFIFGILGIWISNKTNFFYTPKTSKTGDGQIYKILGIILILSSVLAFFTNIIYVSKNLLIFETLFITVIAFAYFRKPFNSDIVIKKHSTIPERIMNIFLITTIVIMIISIIISMDVRFTNEIGEIFNLEKIEIILSMMLLTDVLALMFFIPALTIIRYIEIKVMDPILSFSQIEKFIHENKKIESDGLVGIYSDYINEKTEIGTLARSYTNLIKFNNSYIENIEEIEGERKRIEAELDIATRIQAANLPVRAIESDDYIVNGYSKPAKEVGGDFFDYYPLDDDNLAVVIGDASGKGVPAAILAMISQVIIKQLFHQEPNPSKVLYSLNNQVCENNSESMFITLWLGIYNKTTKKLIFSNAGHNPPLIKENGEFKYLEIDTGIVIGIMEDFEFINEEIILTDEIVTYTDGITDTNNEDYELYGPDRLLKFFSEYESDTDPIRPLLADINKFANGTKQFDDMTLLYLKVK